MILLELVLRFFYHAVKNIYIRIAWSRWNGEDPFSEEYSTRRPIRHAAELIAQMAIYLNGLIGELLFPVHLNIFKSEFIDIPLEKKMIENIHVKWLEDAKYSKCRKTEKYERRLEREDKDKRPWIREKKSWVFYKDNVKDDVTIIRREIGNDIFLLDCRSARLHIWSGEANTFVTISAKNLLKSVEGQERNRKAKEFYGYEIYYKGIELQKSKKIDSDSFIEYVDIKGDLERDCLNLSRRGFTQKGEKYYTEKINVELQKSIRNVLKYLGEINVSVIMQEIIKRCNKIEKMLDLKGVNSETERELNELKEQVISAVILIFLSRRGEYNEKTTYEIFEKHKKNKLDELNRKIVSYFAGKLYNENNELEKEPKNTYVKLQENFLVFSIRVYNERVTPKSAMDLTDFFHPNRHFAILQKRDSFMDVWNSYLIELDGPSGENIYNDFKRLVFLRDSEERNEIYEKIDGWVEQIIKDARQKQSDERDFRQQLLMNWILKNVPTIAMLSDISGNIRINVLNDKVYPYIYMNSKFKTLILRRMAEEYEKNQTERFSTIAWQEREFLSCEQVPFSAYFVKRGMLAKQSYSKVIFPIDGKYLNTLHRGMEGVTELKYVKNMKRVLKELNIQEYLQTIVSQKEVDEESKEVQDWEKLILKLKEGMEQGNLLQSINEFFTDFITAEIKSNEIKVNMEVVERNLARRIEGRYKAWQEIYLEIAQIYLRLIEADSEKDFEELRDKLDTIREQQAFEDLCILIRFFKEGKWKEVFWEKVKDALVLQKYEDLNEERILDYIEEHGKYPISRENMEICYREFESEVLALFENVALEKVAPEIEEAMKMLPQIDQKTQEEDHGNDE